MRKIWGSLVSLICLSEVQGTFFDQHQRGWHWYEPQVLPEAEKPQEDLPQKESKKPLKKKTKTPSEVLAAYRKELENRLAQAWITPTLQNLKSYQTMQKDINPDF